MLSILLVDQRGLALLFETIGERHARGFETDEARVAGARVRWELTHAARLIAENTKGAEAPAQASPPVQ